MARDARRGGRARAGGAGAGAERARPRSASRPTPAGSSPPRAPATACCAASARRWPAPPAGAPLHVVLDDAHWCDPASAQALGHLLESAPVASWSLVVTARDREMGRGHPVSRVLADLRRTGDLSELRLAGLDAAGLAALVGARGGAGDHAAARGAAPARTAGNPFFAGELVRDLDGRGALREGEALDAAPVPDAVTDLVEERLARLDPAHRAAAGRGRRDRPLGAGRARGRGGRARPGGGRARGAGGALGAARRRRRRRRSRRSPSPTRWSARRLIAGTGDAARARLHLAIARALEEDPERRAGRAGPPLRARGRADRTRAGDRRPPRRSGGRRRGARPRAGRRPPAQRALPAARRTSSPARAPALLELGEQELLSADLVRAREVLPRRGRGGARDRRRRHARPRRARLRRRRHRLRLGDRHRRPGDGARSCARGWRRWATSEPRLALRMIFRLVYLLVFTEDDEVLRALVRRAEELERQLGDAEAKVLAGFTTAIAKCAPPPDILPHVLDDPRGHAWSCSIWRRDATARTCCFRVVQLSAVAHYALGRIPECERRSSAAAEIATRLGSPRFAWEVDLNRGMRLIDRGDAGGRRGAAPSSRGDRAAPAPRHPDRRRSWSALMLAEWIFDGETARSRVVYEAMEAATTARGSLSAFASLHDRRRRRSRDRPAAPVGSCSTDDLEPLPRPDVHMPHDRLLLALTATIVGDREAGARLRQLLEPMRPYLLQAAPGDQLRPYCPEWHIGRLELLAGRPEAAVGELRAAVARADELEVVWLRAPGRESTSPGPSTDHGDADEAEASLAEAEALAERYGLGWVEQVRRRGPRRDRGSRAGGHRRSTERTRPIRALATRGGRRALGRDGARPRRRRARASLRRAPPPAGAGSRDGARIPAGSGRRLQRHDRLRAGALRDRAARRRTLALGDRGRFSRRRRARLLEPAPLDAAVTIHFGLAEWVRVAAGIEDALAAMVAGRCSVEGDVVLAARLEAMFGGR